MGVIKLLDAILGQYLLGDGFNERDQAWVLGEDHVLLSVGQGQLDLAHQGAAHRLDESLARLLGVFLLGCIFHL